MNTSPPAPPRLFAADWPSLTEREQNQALDIARQEGGNAVRWYLAEAADGRGAPVSLRHCRWALVHADLGRIDDDLLHRYAAAHTLAREEDYLTFLLEPACPARSEAWWSLPKAERLEDPRVCAFCDGYERERCRVLSLAPPSAAITDLQLGLAAAREYERENAREWLADTEQREAAAEDDAPAPRWSPVRCEYERSLRATDLAHMLLDSALQRARLRRTARGLSPC
jgi:hypothetical protein